MVERGQALAARRARSQRRLSREERVRIGGVARSARGSDGLLAEAFGVVPRTIRRWKSLDPDQVVRRPGRPRLTEQARSAARELVRAELDRQGWATGEAPIHRALAGALSLARVRHALHELKAARRAEQRRRAEEVRVHTGVNARDVLWSADATHLGRDMAGAAILAEVVREVASTCTLAISVGHAASGEEVVRLLDSLVKERGQAPLVLVTDNGPAYRSMAVAIWCQQHGVTHLFSLPRRPQHNPWAENGMRELKEDADLDLGGTVHDVDEARRQLERSRARIDGARLRPSRGWRTAREAERELPSWTALMTREAFQREVACGISKAVLDSRNGRAGRRAIREAILSALERTGAITRTRGRPVRGAQETDDVS